MVEPRYYTLEELQKNPDIPQEIRDLIFEWHIKQRNRIGEMLGTIEVAFRRGYQAGFEDGKGKKKRKYG